MTRFPDDDRHHCKYRRDRDEALAKVERLREWAGERHHKQLGAELERDKALAERDGQRDVFEAAVEWNAARSERDRTDVDLWRVIEAEKALCAAVVALDGEEK